MNSDSITLKTEERAIFRLRELYERYGYTQYKMSKFEEYDLYVRNKSFLVSDSIITFTDTNGKLLALKPDVTLSIVKNSKDTIGTVQKVYYNENVYRVSAKTHSFREIMQVGLECLGDIDDCCIGEVLSLAAESLGQISPDYILNISHLGLLSYVMDRINISPAGKKKLLSCVAEKNSHDLFAVCLEEKANPGEVELLQHLTECGGTPDEALKKLSALLPDDDWQTELARLSTLLSLLPKEQIRIDFSIVNDMNYYNGIAFQGFVNGVPESVLSGGQYDNLMHRMEKKSGAVGFAVYLDRLDSLAAAKKSYDIDTLLLYPADAPADAVCNAVKEMASNGNSVTAQKTIPEKLRYRRLARWTAEGVKIVEENA